MCTQVAYLTYIYSNGTISWDLYLVLAFVLKPYILKFIKDKDNASQIIDFLLSENVFVASKSRFS